MLLQQLLYVEAIVTTSAHVLVFEVLHQHILEEWTWSCQNDNVCCNLLVIPHTPGSHVQFQCPPSEICRPKSFKICAKLGGNLCYFVRLERNISDISDQNGLISDISDEFSLLMQILKQVALTQWTEYSDLWTKSLIVYNSTICQIIRMAPETWWNTLLNMLVNDHWTEGPHLVRLPDPPGVTDRAEFLAIILARKPPPGNREAFTFICYKRSQFYQRLRYLPDPHPPRSSSSPRWKRSWCSKTAPPRLLISDNTN